MASGKAIPPSVKTIPDLITWLADEYHEGHPSRMHAKLGISIATSNFWARGAVLPNLDNLERLCDVYSLPIDKVFELWRKSSGKRRRRIATISGGSDGPPPPSAGVLVTRMLLIRHWWQFWLARPMQPLLCPA